MNNSMILKKRNVFRDILSTDNNVRNLVIDLAFLLYTVVYFPQQPFCLRSVSYTHLDVYKRQ